MVMDDNPSLMDVCLESFFKFRQEKIKALRESIAQGDFMIHPKIIASNWLNADLDAFQIPEQIE